MSTGPGLQTEVRSERVNDPEATRLKIDKEHVRAYSDPPEAPGKEVLEDTTTKILRRRETAAEGPAVSFAAARELGRTAL